MYNNIKIKYILSTLIISFFCLIQINEVKATHIVGGEMTYRCLGNNQYEINLAVYRDCNFGDALAYFDNPAYVSIFYGNSNALYDTLHLPFIGIDDTLNMFNPCLEFQPNVCVHTTRYSTIVTLPFNPGGFILAYQRCCRNQTINNIVEPLNTGATYTAWISELAMTECNSSAVFNNWPPVYVCVNSPLYFDHSAFDVDGDSIVYQLTAPYSGAIETLPRPQIASNPPFSTVTWSGNYNLNNLLNATSTGTPLTINPVTGEMVAVPNTLGQFVVGVIALEYRNGQLISTTRRDFQYNVENCIETTSMFQAPMAQCDNLTIQCNNNSINSDNFTWDFGEPGSLNNISTAQNPSHTYQDTGRYTITLVVEPNTICADTFLQEVYLQYNSLTPDFTFGILNCSDSIVIQASDNSADLISPVIGWEWVLSNASGGTVATSNINNPQFVVQNGGNYVLTLTATTQNGCVQSVSRSFTAIDANDPLVADTLQLCSLMPINLNPVATNGAIYNWSPATGFDPSTPSPVVTPTQSITYTVTISDPASLCSVIKTIRLNVANGAPELPDITNTCNANVILAAANSNAQYTYEWSTNPNFNSVFAVTPLISITPSPGQTAYYLRVRTPEGCLYIDSTLVNSNGAAIHVNGQNPSAVCSGDNFIWSVTNEDSTDFNTYLWSPAELITGGNGTIGINVNTIPVGTHTFTVVATNQYGCTAVDTATLSILNNPEMSFIPGNINCDGLTVCFQNTSTNAGLYLWDFDDNGNTSTAFQPCYTFSDTGHYFVSLTVGTPVACNDTFMTEVYLPGPINNASFTWTQLDCTDSTATIAFQNTSVLQNQIQSIHWIFETVEGISTSPIMNPTLQINSAQLITATMVINLDNGCVDTARNIINASLIDLTYPVDVVYACDNQPTALNPNGNPNWQYLWSPANAVDNPTSFNPIGNPAVASQFTVSVYDPSTGCSAEDTVQLLPIQNVNLDFTAQQECDSYQVNFTNNSQNAPFYNWYFGDPNNPASSTAVNPSFTYSDTGTYTVVLTLNIGAVCNATLQVPVHVEEPISADFTYTAQDCSEIANISFDNNSTGGTNPQYTWNINGTNTNIENPSYNTTTSPVIASLIAHSANGCNDTIVRTINVNLFSVDLPDTLLYCVGDASIPLNPNGVQTYQYTWSPATGLDDIHSYNPLASPTVSTNYSVTITSPGINDTCVTIQNVFVRASDIMQNIQISNDTFSCGEPVTLTASSDVGVNYVWYNAQGGVIGASQSIMVVPSGNTHYIVRVQDIIGCTVLDTVNVSNRSVVVGFENPLSICDGTPTQVYLMNFDPSDTLTYEWYPITNIVSGGETNSPFIVGSNNFILTGIATNQYGCTDTVEAPVAYNTFGTNLLIDATPDTIFKGEISQLNVTTANSFTYLWSPDSTLTNPNISNPIANPTTTTTYTVLVTDSDGCFDTRSVIVIVLSDICDEPYIFLPNAFTPNGDGENDVLYVRGNYIDKMQLLIYNRWGEKVFESDNKNKGWDGRYKDKLLPPDVYGFYLTVVCGNGKEYKKQGNVTILR